MIATIPNETFQNLFVDLQLGTYEPSANVQALATTESRFIKDLKISLITVLA